MARWSGASKKKSISGKLIGQSLAHSSQSQVSSPVILKLILDSLTRFFFQSVFSLSKSFTSNNSLKIMLKELYKATKRKRVFLWKTQYTWVEEGNGGGVYCSVCRQYPSKADQEGVIFHGNYRKQDF